MINSSGDRRDVFKRLLVLVQIDVKVLLVLFLRCFEQFLTFNVFLLDLVFLLLFFRRILGLLGLDVGDNVDKLGVERFVFLSCKNNLCSQKFHNLS